jgi:hypothetical protein
MMELPSFMEVPSRIIQAVILEVPCTWNPAALNIQDEGFIRADIPDPGATRFRY